MIEELIKGRTSKDDLNKLAKTFGIPLNKFYVGWTTDKFEHFKKYNILNIGKLFGTHWICLIHDKNKKIYFDPLGFPPEDKFKNYDNANIQIQPIDREMCGQYCVIWLYYYRNNKMLKFYNLFNILNKNCY